ncbi:MAG: sigma-70 family RNA polymerase sigma factor [Candidatus Brocadiia bacterium]|nr:sigma-70 family RNA polymerase sigma factor [Candidatus Brocadiia bacterium]
MSEASCSDLELVARVCGGDTEAFSGLVSRYQDRICNAAARLVARSPDAEDIAQEVFLKAFRNLKGFRREAEFSTWLYGIMLNSVRSYWRGQGRRKDVASFGSTGRSDNPHPSSNPPSPDEGPVELSARSEAVAAVRRAIDELEHDLREVIVLRDIEGASYEQLAQALGLPLGTVKSRLFRARSALREKISPALAGDL